MADHNTVNSNWYAFRNESLASGASALSSIRDVGTSRGNLALEVTVTGSGTIDLVALGGITNDVMRPVAQFSSDTLTSNTGKILTNFSATGGPDSDGKTVIGLSLPYAPKLQFKVTESGGAASVTVTTILGEQ